MICNIFLFTKNKCLVNHDSIVQNNEKTTLVIIHHEPAITFTTVILDKFKDPYPYIWIYYIYETHIYLLFWQNKNGPSPRSPRTIRVFENLWIYLWPKSKWWQPNVECGYDDEKGNLIHLRNSHLSLKRNNLYYNERILVMSIFCLAIK